MGLHELFTLILIACLTIAVVIDIKSHRIPNWLTLVTLCSGFTHHILIAGTYGFMSSLGGSIVAFACLLPFYIKGSMGAGDVKLMAAVCSFLSVKAGFMAVAYTMLFGGLFAVVVLVARRQVKTFFIRHYQMVKVFSGTREWLYLPASEGNVDQERFPYALAICAGGLTSAYQSGWFSQIL